MFEAGGSEPLYPLPAAAHTPSWILRGPTFKGRRGGVKKETREGEVWKGEGRRGFSQLKFLAPPLCHTVVIQWEYSFHWLPVVIQRKYSGHTIHDYYMITVWLYDYCMIIVWTLYDHYMTIWPLFEHYVNMLLPYDQYTSHTVAWTSSIKVV